MGIVSATIVELNKWKIRSKLIKMETTTIRIRKETVMLLEDCRIHPRETWDDIINRVLDEIQEVKK